MAIFGSAEKYSPRGSAYGATVSQPHDSTVKLSAKVTATVAG